MASTGKGRRRVKGTTLDLGSFLGDQKAAPGFAVVTPKLDWADYVEEETDDKYSSYRKEEKQIVLPTAPKAARGPDFDISKIPSEPPFTAYIGNLPFDITEEEIMRFFGSLPVLSVRLPRDGGDRGRMRGFGYAEFENKQALIEALSLNGETLKSRPVKVSLAGENAEGDRNERRNDTSDRTAGDWRAAPKSEDSFAYRSQRNGAGRYEDSDREPYRGRSSYGEDRGRFDGGRQAYQGRRSADRDRDFFSERDRGYGRRYGDGGFDRGFDRSSRGERREEFDFRRDDRGFGRSGRTERRDNFERRDDDQERGFARSGRTERRENVEQRDEDQGRERPKDRPRLQLKPRSVPVGEQPSAAPVASAIFGGAKPVDTAAKEREIELRLAKEREKLIEDGGKPKFASWSDDPPESERISRKGDGRKPEEPLREKNHTRGDGTERTLKEIPQYPKSGAHFNEQENGEPGMRRNFQFRKWSLQESNSSSKSSNINGGESELLSKKRPPYPPRNQKEFQKESFLSNKFAHLSSQED